MWMSGEACTMADKSHVFGSSCKIMIRTSAGKDSSGDLGVAKLKCDICWFSFSAAAGVEFLVSLGSCKAALV